MSIAARIRLFQIVVALAIAAMAVNALIDIRSTAFHRERVGWARDQLTAITRLAVVANRYSEQIAELLLIGEPERPDFESARAQVSQAFADLRQLTVREIAFIRETAEHEDEQQELERLDRMQALFRGSTGRWDGCCSSTRKGGATKPSPCSAPRSRTASTPSSSG